MESAEANTSINIEVDWLRKLLPDGLPVRSSTVISGPGGTGKPLVLFAFVASWLKSGGSIISIPLQYPTTEFVSKALSEIYNINLNDYKDKVIHVKFDPKIDSYENVNGNNIIKANLLKPEVWDSVIREAENKIVKNKLGVLVFGSALNLLLFSPTYKNILLDKINKLLKDKTRTYLFSVSTSAFSEEIKLWEESADNLMFTRMEKPMKLFFKIERMKNVRFQSKESFVPIPQKVLLDIKRVAEATRSRIIPELTKI